MRPTRRSFLQKSAALMATAMLAPRVVRGQSIRSVADRINVALIGCNGMGFYNLQDHLKIPNVECVALCDVDESVLNRRAADVAKITGRQPKLIKDFRRIIDDKDIDVVIVGTPDHWHCLPTVYACEAGKDVYVEKPLANSIYECDVMLNAARKFKRIVQVGQQQRSGSHWQQIIELVKAGRVGQLRKIKAWGFFEYGRTSPRVPDSAAPTGVDYDLWLGPAPQRPFNTGRFHGNWRFSWDYGGGLLTDWGVHLLDIALWAVNEKMPDTIQSVGGIYAYKGNQIETADTQTVLYGYEDLHIEWEHLGGLHSGYYGRGYGVAFIGNDGTIVVNREGWELIPEIENGKPKTESIALQPADRSDHIKHVTNFIESVRTRALPICDVETGRNAATLAHMGNIAYRTGDKLQWDRASRQFISNQKATDLITPSYRKPWKLPVR
ncbi:Gfo/Idh/MocA family oxidoreductase [Chryseolinea sp. T2]|uniref:Gfo/Idh/MocA family protein n=1 Tax=Chryseolinea sp. T2 TaxID=3129255 RepID=UPI003077FE56